MTPADEFYMRRNKLNCCNEYGDCRQGRDCPARKSADFDAAHSFRREPWDLITIYAMTALVCVVGLIILFILVVL